MAYIPTPGPLPGQRYTPSNGTEGEQFIDDWCRTCQRDRALRDGVDLDDCDDDEKCEIVAAAYREEAVEWRELDDGQTICIAWVPAGQPIPAPRCEHTCDMFEAP